MRDNPSAFNSFEYDEKIRKTLPFYDEYYRQTTNFINVLIDKAIDWLDVGCGTGRMAQEAFASCNINRFIFSDVSEAMINICRVRFADTNSKFRNESVLEISDIEAFDVITAIQVFHFLQEDERKAAIRKCYEALRPGGILVYFENIIPEDRSLIPVYLERWKEYQISKGKSSEEASAHVGRYGNEYFPITIKNHLKILEKIGFKSCDILWMSIMQAGFLAIK